jgi:hypothetical protein
MRRWRNGWACSLRRCGPFNVSQRMSRFRGALIATPPVCGVAIQSRASCRSHVTCTKVLGARPPSERVGEGAWLGRRSRRHVRKAREARHSGGGEQRPLWLARRVRRERRSERRWRRASRRSSGRSAAPLPACLPPRRSAPSVPMKELCDCWAIERSQTRHCVGNCLIGSFDDLDLDPRQDFGERVGEDRSLIGADRREELDTLEGRF